MKKTIYMFLMLIPTYAMAASDSGKIIEVYAHPGGQMAVMLDNGLPNAHAVNNCGHTGNALNQWAGVSATVDSSIKAAILAAKAAGNQVTLITSGNCFGTWIKIEAMHVR